ncbi:MULTISPECIES: hypothetical protein [Luteimonas]|uniref:hypothetical protein n=1 Tax=Luteimonas TaxID=83614 RepID=UPI001E352FD6|nr:MULTISPECIES: hypothetical protein [Luteimonas]
MIATRARRTGAGALALLLAAVGAPGVVFAAEACPAPIIRALADASLLPADGAPALVAQACRVWPFDPALSLAAVAYPLPASEAPVPRELRLVVAVLGTQDTRPLAVHTTDLAEDAVFALDADGLRLDTARYDLAPGVRAFGVVLRSAAPGASCPDGRFNDELTLYVRNGSALRPVFSSYLELWQRIEGEPCSWTLDQRLVTEDAALSIGVEPGTHHGYADLRVIANVSRTERATGSSGDDAVTTQRRASRVVHYDGARYDVDALHNGFFWIRDPVDE